MPFSVFFLLCQAETSDDAIHVKGGLQVADLLSYR
jgi:hypothetical protein